MTAACLLACRTQSQSQSQSPESTGWVVEPLPRVVLPLRDSLDGFDLTVEATLEGPGRKRQAAWMLLDTASDTIISLRSLQDLGLVPIGNRTIRTLSTPVVARTASLPRLLLGDLIIESLPVAALTLPDDLRVDGIVGGQVLSHSPWEISWDRGTVTLNATPWLEGGDVWGWPLTRGDDGLDRIDVRVNGAPIRLLFDTGCNGLAIPRNVATGIGLAAMPTEIAKAVGTAGTLPADTPMFVAALEIGSHKLEGQRFFGTPDGGFAALGLAALSAYELQILPHRRVLFRPRNRDMRATAAMRVRRWPWMPPCRAVGCVRAYVEGSGKSGRIIFELEAALPRPVSMLLGCVDAPAPLWQSPRAQRPYWDLRVEPEEAALAARAYEVLAPDIEKALPLPGGRRCHELTVLDVIPLGEIDRHPKEAKLWVH